MSAQHRMSATEWSLLALLSLLWGGSFFFAKIAVGALPPLTVVLVRVGLAAGALGLVLRLSGTPLPRTGALWWAFAGMGVLNNLVPFALIFWGETVLSGGLASILNATTPVFSVLVAHALTSDDRLTAGKIVGIAVMIATDPLGTRPLFAFHIAVVLACWPNTPPMNARQAAMKAMIATTLIEANQNSNSP